MRVLLLDDEPSAAALCEALHAHVADLRRAPARVRDPASLLDVEQPDVIVLGPAGRGELARVMAAVGGRTPPVPVVVVGEHDRAEAAIDDLKGGATDYVMPGAPGTAARVGAAAFAPEPPRRVALPAPPHQALARPR